MNNKHTYIDYVQECFDVLIEYGTDRYGEKQAPILVSILDVESRSCPENPDQLDEQWRVQRRGRRNPAGANMLMDMPTLKTMFLLSKVAENDKYAGFARTYMDYYMKNLVDSKGFFWWGWHRHYDVYKDEMTGHNGNPHELHATHYIPWDKLWEINSSAVLKEIEAIWQWHVCDKATGEIDRHDSDSQGCDFSISSGSFIHAFAFLYSQTKEDIWLSRAKLLATYYWDRRNKATNLFPERPNAGTERFDGSHFVTTIPGLHCHALLKTYELTVDELFKDYAVAYLSAYAKYGFDENTGKFWGSLNLDGTPVFGPQIMEGYAANEPRGHLDLWGPYVLGYQAPIYTAQAYAYAYHLTKDESFLTTAKRFANLIEKAPPTNGCLEESWYKGYAQQYAPYGTYAGKYGRVISFFIYLYILTKEDRYLEFAKDVADEAIDKLYFTGLFRGHPVKPYYEATDGVGFLLYSLLELSQVIESPREVLGKQAILVGKWDDKLTISLDNR
ncbi:hypothetical protein H8D98_00785 [bacterium]|nr:hypothetical protein [bacterium]